MTLPIAISVPHAGLVIPEEAAPYCQLTREQIIKDGDEFAAEIYDLRDEVNQFVTTDIARAIIDLNRSPDDRRADGVVKTHTIFNEPIYREPLPETAVAAMLDKYYRPYHATLGRLSEDNLLFAVDCHTMASVAPPIGPDPGSKRPELCLGNVQGQSFPDDWTNIVLQAFRDTFSEFDVTLNKPFSGGYITRTHANELPWIQLEVSRSQFLPNEQIRARIASSLHKATSAIGKSNRQ